MNTSNCALKWSAVGDLQRVVEPLASYICAADKPKTALASALAVLLREVEATNQSAIKHFHTHCSRPL